MVESDLVALHSSHVPTCPSLSAAGPIQDVLEEIDPTLEPVLAKSVIKRGNATLIKLGDKEVDYNPDFRLYITTKMGALPPSGPVLSCAFPADLLFDRGSCACAVPCAASATAAARLDSALCLVAQAAGAGQSADHWQHSHCATCLAMFCSSSKSPLNASLLVAAGSLTVCFLHV